MRDWIPAPLLPTTGVLQITRHACPICLREFVDKEEAEACFANGWKPLFEPGDIVHPLGVAGLCKAYEPNKLELSEDGPWGRYGWFNGDARWVCLHIEPGSGRLTYLQRAEIDFYYVVGSVDMSIRWERYPHQPIYHLFTEAICTKNQPYIEGWTCHETHIPMMRAVNPPKEVVEAGKKYVGKRTAYLL